MAMTIDELKLAPIEVVLEQIIENNEGVTASIVADRIMAVINALGWKVERTRVAEPEATLSEGHASTRRMTLDHEWYLGGLRHDPGVYVIMRVGPLPDGYEPTF
jgi:hypothetical protein